MARYKENCSFTWDQFGQSIKQSFREVLDKRDYSDVTLACEDDQQIKAHKLVLCSGSLFFRNILSKIEHPQPFIYLKGIKKDELNSIMNFLYTGESTVAKEQLESFLEIAQQLKVKGLEMSAGSDPVKYEDLESALAETKESKESDSVHLLAVNKGAAKISDHRLYELIDPFNGTYEDQTSNELVKTQEVKVDIKSESVCKHCGEAIFNTRGVKGYTKKHKCQMMVIKRRKVKVAKFKPSWLDMTIQGQSVATWLAPDSENMQRASCTLCRNDVTFNINEGWKAVKQHYKTAKHQESLDSSFLLA